MYLLESSCVKEVDVIYWLVVFGLIYILRIKEKDDKNKKNCFCLSVCVCVSLIFNPNIPHLLYIYIYIYINYNIIKYLYILKLYYQNRLDYNYDIINNCEDTVLIDYYYCVYLIQCIETGRSMGLSTNSD